MNDTDIIEFRLSVKEAEELNALLGWATGAWIREHGKPPSAVEAIDVFTRQLGYRPNRFVGNDIEVVERRVLALRANPHAIVIPVGN